MLKDLLVNRLVKGAFNVHRPGEQPNVFLFATPRGGSTWLMEMIWSQPGFKICDEPLNLRNPYVLRHLGIPTWEELQSEGAEERLERYFEALDRGRLHIVEPVPFTRQYQRYRTSRIVFKVIHGAEDRVEWLSSRFRGRVVLLLRHPFAVSLSRKVLPRLESFLRSDYRRHFSDEQLRLAAAIIDGGTEIERKILDWCFQNAVPLAHATPEWTVVTYEQLVLEPEVVIPLLAERLSLPEPARMFEHITIASSVTRQSDARTKSLLEQGESSEARAKLVEKWRGRVTADDERRAARILECFGLDAYEAGSALPHSRYWHPGPAGARAHP